MWGVSGGGFCPSCCSEYRLPARFFSSVIIYVIIPYFMGLFSDGKVGCFNPEIE